MNRYMDIPKPVYGRLLELIKDKDYFVLTTNVDHCFQKVGFDKERLFYTQGDYGLFQCIRPCCKKTYDNKKIILDMVKEQKDMRIPEALAPRCPVCGSPMTVNLRADDTFVEDEGWHAAARRYEDFIRTRGMGRILYLELGAVSYTHLEGLTFTTMMDQGDYIYLIIGAIAESLGYGALFAVIILLLFLRDIKPTLITLLSIPVSIMFAIVLMYFSGVTLNMISLSGLAVAVGMLVDNSIVVIENTFRLRRMGVPAKKAAVAGAKQVSGAIRCV